MTLRPEQLALLEALPDLAVDLILEELQRAGRGGEVHVVLPIGRDGRVDGRKTRVLPAWRWGYELTRRADRE